jgi:Plasmid encoded RepA protein
MGAITEPARTPFGGEDQQTLDDFEQFWGREALDNPMIGFNHYWNTSLGLPYRNPGMIDLWVRKDGNLIFTMRNGHAIKPDSDDMVLQGYPYGIWPRRLQAVINAEIVRSRGQREIYVGPGFTSYFRKKLGINMTGGKTGSIARAKEQMVRMSSATYRFFVRGERSGFMYNPSSMIEKCGVYFDGEEDHWPMVLVISQAYRDSLCTEGNAVPVDINAMLRIEGAMEHDIYSWATRRVYGVRPGKPIFISNESLKYQFGRSYGDPRDFRKDFRLAVHHIRKEVYPELKLEEGNGGWKLSSSKLAVTERKFWRGYSEPRQLNIFAEPEPDEPEETVERLVAVSTLQLKKRLPPNTP